MKSYAHRASELRLLISKYAKGQLTMHEKQKLDEFMRRSPQNAELVELLVSPDGPAQLLERQARLDKIWGGQDFRSLVKKVRRRRRPYSLQLIVVTLTILLLIGVATYFLIKFT